MSSRRSSIEDIACLSTRVNAVSEIEFYEDLLYNDTLYTPPVSQHVKCSVCLDVMQRPVQCPSGHSFCQKCIFLALKDQRMCPVCRVRLSSSHLVVNRAMEGVIQDLVLCCPTTLDPEPLTAADLDGDSLSSSPTEGQVLAFSEPVPRCEWTGQLNDCPAHLAICSNARVRCELPHCQQVLPRRLMPAHRNTCVSSPGYFFHMYIRTRCGSLESWEQLQQLAGAHSLAGGFAALVLTLSHISSVPKDLSAAQDLAESVVPILQKVVAERQMPEGEVHTGSRQAEWPHAAFVLGSLLFEGVGFSARQPEKAVAHFQAAARVGHAGAQCSLGLCYDSGSGVTLDMSRAVQLYRQSAEQGYAAAQLNLGMCCFHGEGLPQDRVAALEYYQQAADQGHATALFNLGVCLSSGEGGVVCNEEAGVRCVRAAALQGFEPAQQYLNKYRLSLY